MHRLYNLFILTLLVALSSQKLETLSGKAPIIIGERGASGYRPEHTIDSYTYAIKLGVDMIEAEVVLTKDGHLICRSEPMLSFSTNVAEIAEFADKKSRKVVNGVEYEDWFAGDFTLEEIKKLRVNQVEPDRNQDLNGKFPIPAFDEVIDLVKNKSKELGKQILILCETKVPTFHKREHLPLNDRLLCALENAGWNHHDSPVYVKSFEVHNLQYIAKKSSVKIIQVLLAWSLLKDGSLNETDSQPYDLLVSGDTRDSIDLATDKGLDFIKTYANGISVWKPFIIPYTYKDENDDGQPDDLNGDGQIDSRDFLRLPATDIIKRAHKRDLIVLAWKFTNEKSWLLEDYDGNPKDEFQDYFELGVDAVYSDYADTAVEARNEFLKDN